MPEKRDVRALDEPLVKFNIKKIEALLNRAAKIKAKCANDKAVVDKIDALVAPVASLYSNLKKHGHTKETLPSTKGYLEIIENDLAHYLDGIQGSCRK